MCGIEITLCLSFSERKTFYNSDSATDAYICLLYIQMLQTNAQSHCLFHIAELPSEREQIVFLYIYRLVTEIRNKEMCITLVNITYERYMLPVHVIDLSPEVEILAESFVRNKTLFSTPHLSFFAYIYLIVSINIFFSYFFNELLARL